MDVLRAALQGSVLVCALLAPVAALAQADESELRIKAAFLYKFGSFVEWPASVFASPQSPFVLGVLGNDELGDELERVAAGRKVHEHPIVIRRLRRGDSLAGLHVLFVGAAEGRHLGEILEGAKGRALLVVTDAPQGAPPPGSMINFVAENDKVRFDVALAPAEEGRLKISSRLLGVARRVVSG